VKIIKRGVKACKVELSVHRDEKMVPKFHCS